MRLVRRPATSMRAAARLGWESGGFVFSLSYEWARMEHFGTSGSMAVRVGARLTEVPGPNGTFGNVGEDGLLDMVSSLFGCAVAWSLKQPRRSDALTVNRILP